MATIDCYKAKLKVAFPRYPGCREPRACTRHALFRDPSCMVWRSLSLSKIIEQIPIGVVITRPDGRIEYANSRAQALLDGRGKALAGRELAALRVGDPVGLAGDGEDWQGESRFGCRAGHTTHVFEAVYPVRRAGGKLACRIHFLEDLSAQKHAERLSALAYCDALTGLPNRLVFEDRLARAILAAKRTGAVFALLYIDLDRFKAINDTWGHDAGDCILREATARMMRALRESDTLARLGGDEFAAILEGIRTQQNAIKVAEKLLKLCRQDFELNGSPVRVGLSVGISLFPQHGREAAALLKQADEAMYRAKVLGRGRHCVADNRS